ncbi:MAG: hypothetical protein HY646_09860 [Acidobacteria bacterium]|nr:hypothetical protein [Acidobacteriota bacterium]
MKSFTHLFPGLVAAVLVLLFSPAVCADHDFDEHFEQAGEALADADEINQEEGDEGLFRRSGLAGTPFLPDPLLPVSSGDVSAGGEPDKELLWEVEAGDQETVALTPDSPLGNYPGLGVRVETFFAAVGDVESGAWVGAVARHSQHVYYIAYGMVLPTEEGLKIQFLLQKKVLAGSHAFSPLDEYTVGPASALFSFREGENFRVRLDVTAPDGEGCSRLCAHFERVVIGEEGERIFDPLATLIGRDCSLNTGRVGVYASSGSVLAATKIAFDPVHVAKIDGLPARCLLVDLEGAIGGLDVRPEEGDMLGPKDDVKSARKKILLRHVARSSLYLDDNDFAALARELQFVRERANGSAEPPDWVAGSAAVAIVMDIDAILSRGRM